MASPHRTDWSCSTPPDVSRKTQAWLFVEKPRHRHRNTPKLLFFYRYLNDSLRIARSSIRRARKGRDNASEGDSICGGSRGQHRAVRSNAPGKPSRRRFRRLLRRRPGAIHTDHLPIGLERSVQLCRLADERLEGLLVDIVALAKIDGAPSAAIKARIEQS